MTSTIDFDRCYRAVESRDARFDGWFITAVTSTGIYCRPSCPTPIRPKRKNVAFYPTAAAAQGAGFRACKRCRPDASPGSPEWDLRADLTGRAMRLIADGCIDRVGVTGLAASLAVSERNLTRILQRELGASPLAIARAQRAQTARVLIETTDLKFSDVAFAAGFSSIRQFNDTVQQVFAQTPTVLRRAASTADGHSDKDNKQRGVQGAVGLRLAIRQPFQSEPLLAWFAGHLPANVAQVDAADNTIRRTLRTPHGAGFAELTLHEDHVWCTISLADLADLSVAVSRLRRLLDLDADPESVQSHLEGTELGSLVARDPGLRVPGAVDGFEQAVLTVLGQQVSVAAGRTFATRLVEAFGEPTDSGRKNDPVAWRLFPTAETLTSADLGSLGITGSRQRTLGALAQAVVNGELDLSPGADRARTRSDLLALPGIGPWTADVVAMRALGDPDVFPTADLVLIKVVERLGLPTDAKRLAQVAASWAPWRSYAAHHVWASVYPQPCEVS